MVHNVITNIGKIYFIAYYCATHKNYITIYVFKARLEKLPSKKHSKRVAFSARGVNSRASLTNSLRQTLSGRQTCKRGNKFENKVSFESTNMLRLPVFFINTFQKLKTMPKDMP